MRGASGIDAGLAQGVSSSSSRSSRCSRLEMAASRGGRRRRVHAEHLAHLAHGHARAVGDDHGRHGGAVGAVLVEDVLDDALALLARGQVDVDVGPLAALLREEALEEQLHGDGVDGGDAQGVTHGAVGRGAAPLGEDALLAREAGDVVDDEEVAGQVELLDQRARARAGRARAGRGEP